MYGGICPRVSQESVIAIRAASLVHHPIAQDTEDMYSNLNVEFIYNLVTAWSYLAPAVIAVCMDSESLLGWSLAGSGQAYSIRCLAHTHRVSCRVRMHHKTPRVTPTTL